MIGGGWCKKYDGLNNGSAQLSYGFDWIDAVGRLLDAFDELHPIRLAAADADGIITECKEYAEYCTLWG